MSIQHDLAGLVADFERENARLLAATEATLAGIIADGPVHARFLNTLSLLEHMGSHKIMATQHGRKIDQPTLKHMAEETRHAFFFKRQAERTAGHSMTYESGDLVAAPAARRYFQRLEAEIVRTLPVGADPRTAYLTMSLVVEFRAAWTYRIYQGTLESTAKPFSLASLIAEESGHLGDMAERLEDLSQFDRSRVVQLCRLEKALYERLLVALDRRAVTPCQA